MEAAAIVVNTKAGAIADDACVAVYTQLAQGWKGLRNPCLMVVYLWANLTSH